MTDHGTRPASHDLACDTCAMVRAAADGDPCADQGCSGTFREQEAPPPAGPPIAIVVVIVVVCSVFVRLILALGRP